MICLFIYCKKIWRSFYCIKNFRFGAWKICSYLHINIIAVISFIWGILWDYVFPPMLTLMTITMSLRKVPIISVYVILAFTPDAASQKGRPESRCTRLQLGHGNLPWDYLLKFVVISIYRQKTPYKSRRISQKCNASFLFIQIFGVVVLIHIY